MVNGTSLEVVLNSALALEQRNVRRPIGACNADVDEVGGLRDPCRIDDVATVQYIPLRPRPVKRSRREHGIGAGCRLDDRANIVEVDPHDLDAALSDPGRRPRPSRPRSNTMTGG
jgi:hypothetical protein